MYYYFVLAWLFSFLHFSHSSGKIYSLTKVLLQIKGEGHVWVSILGVLIGSCSVITLFKFSSWRIKESADWGIAERGERRNQMYSGWWLLRGKQRMLWENIFTFLFQIATISHVFRMLCVHRYRDAWSHHPWCLSSPSCSWLRVWREFWAGLYIPGRFNSP